MIKKLQHIITGLLVILYLALSIGIEIDLHYCLGELKDVSFFNHQDKAENCCSDNVCVLEKAFDCCDSEHLCYHIEADQLTNKQIIKLNPGSDQEKLLNANIYYLTNNNWVYLNEFNAAPDTCPYPSPIYLLNCSLIHYG